MSRQQSVAHCARRYPWSRAITASALTLLMTSTLSIGVASASTSHATRVTVTTSSSTSLGTYLTSSNRTLYTLNAASCPTACLKYWPPLVLTSSTSKAVAGSGVSASKLGKVKDANGAWQVTYGGKPLYFFILDKSAHAVKGNDLTDTWGTWKIVVTLKPKSSGGGSPTSTTTTTSPGTGGVSF